MTFIVSMVYCDSGQVLFSGKFTKSSDECAFLIFGLLYNGPNECTVYFEVFSNIEYIYKIENTSIVKTTTTTS